VGRSVYVTVLLHFHKGIDVFIEGDMEASAVARFPRGDRQTVERGTDGAWALRQVEPLTSSY
jgi:hypothetical protein